MSCTLNHVEQNSGIGMGELRLIKTLWQESPSYPELGPLECSYTVGLSGIHTVATLPLGAIHYRVLYDSISLCVNSYIPLISVQKG